MGRVIMSDNATFATIGTGVIAVFCAFFFWIFCLNHLAVQEVGITYNSWTGDIGVQRQPGWHITGPTVSVATVSTLPTQVCLYAGSRITNCKLVRFKATDEAVAEFVMQQGFHYYNGGNSRSNCNNGGTCSGVPLILKGYAFSGETPKFLEIIREENPLSKG
jgi:hypothetical protein